VTDRIVSQFISEAKKALLEISESAMTYPNPDPFEHGVSCGRHQGLRMALDMLEIILTGDREEASKP